MPDNNSTSLKSCIKGFFLKLLLIMNLSWDINLDFKHSLRKLKINGNNSAEGCEEGSTGPRFILHPIEIYIW